MKSPEKNKKIEKNIEKWLDEGRSVQSSGKYEEAIEYFDKVIEINANNPEAWMWKGYALRGLGLHA